MWAAPAHICSGSEVLECEQTESLANTHPGVCDFELTQDVLGHVVLSHRVDNKVLVASRTLCWPVLVALLLWTQGPAPMIR